MADKEVIVRVKVEGLSAGAIEVQKLNVQFAQLNKEYKDLQKTVAANRGNATQDQITKLASLAAQMKDNKNAQADYTKTMNAADDSLNKMRRDLIILKDNYANAGAAARENMAPAILDLNNKILASEAAIGVHQRNVGNYPQFTQTAAGGLQQLTGVVGGTTGAIGDAVSSMATAGGAAGVFTVIIGALASAWNAANENVKKYLESADKLKYGGSGFQQDAGESLKDTTKRARGGVTEGNRLESEAKNRLTLNQYNTEEEKKQLELQILEGQQMQKDNRDLLTSLGKNRDLGTSIKDQVGWKLKYRELLKEEEKLNDSKLEKETEWEAMEAKLTQQREIVSSLESTKADKEKASIEAATIANKLVKEKTEFLDNQIVNINAIAEMTATQEVVEDKVNGLLKEKNTILKEYEADQIKINKLERAAEKDGKSALKDKTDAQKEYSKNVKAAFESETALAKLQAGGNIEAQKGALKLRYDQEVQMEGTTNTQKLLLKKQYELEIIKLDQLALANYESEQNKKKASLNTKYILDLKDITLNEEQKSAIRNKYNSDIESIDKDIADRRKALLQKSLTDDVNITNEVNQQRLKAQQKYQDDLAKLEASKKETVKAKSDLKAQFDADLKEVEEYNKKRVHLVDDLQSQLEAEEAKGRGPSGADPEKIAAIQAQMNAEKKAIQDANDQKISIQKKYNEAVKALDLKFTSNKAEYDKKKAELDASLKDELSSITDANSMKLTIQKKYENDVKAVQAKKLDKSESDKEIAVITDRLTVQLAKVKEYEKDIDEIDKKTLADKKETAKKSLDEAIKAIEKEKKAIIDAKKGTGEDLNTNQLYELEKETQSKILALRTDFVDQSAKLDADYYAKKTAALEQQLATDLELTEGNAQAQEDIKKKYTEDVLQINADAAITAQNALLAEVEAVKAAEEQKRQFKIASGEWDKERLIIDEANKLQIMEATNQSQFDIQRIKLQQQHDAEVTAAKKTGADVNLINQKYAALNAQITKAEMATKLSVVADFAGVLSDVLGKNTAAGKAAAVAQATINTYLAASQALATYPPPFSYIAMAAAIITGIMNVQKIIAVDTTIKSTGGAKTPAGYAEGGKIKEGVTIRKSDEDNTINIVGTEADKTTGGKITSGIPVKTATKDDKLIAVNDTETVITDEQMKKLGGPDAMAAAGVPGYFKSYKASEPAKVMPQLGSGVINNLKFPGFVNGGFIGSQPPTIQTGGFNMNELNNLMLSMRQNIESIDTKSDAINSRVDRLQVIQDVNKLNLAQKELTVINQTSRI
jgi:hypothetical protein